MCLLLREYLHVCVQSVGGWYAGLQCMYVYILTVVTCVRICFCHGGGSGGGGCVYL